MLLLETSASKRQTQSSAFVRLEVFVLHAGMFTMIQLQCIIAKYPQSLLAFTWYLKMALQANVFLQICILRKCLEVNKWNPHLKKKNCSLLTIVLINLDGINVPKISVGIVLHLKNLLRTAFKSLSPKQASKTPQY